MIRLDEYLEMEIEKGTWDECIVTHIEDPESLYVQLASSLDELNSLLDKLEAHCSKLGPSDGKPSVLGLGVPVAAKYSADGNWYRATITGTREFNCLAINPCRLFC